MASTLNTVTGILGAYQGYFTGQGGSLSPDTFALTGSSQCAALLTGLSAGNASLIMGGDQTAVLAGTKLVIDGVDHPIASTPTFDGTSTTVDYTRAAAFTNGGVYTVDVVDPNPYAGPTYVGISTGAGSNNAFNISFASSGRASGDLLLIGVMTANQPITAPTGFTQEGSTQFRGTAGVGGGVALQVFRKVSDGTEGNVSIPDGGDIQYAAAVVIRGAGGAAVAVDVSAGNNVAATTSGSFGGVTTTGDHRMVVTFVATDRDAAAASWSAQANASLVNFAKRFDNGTTTGTGGGIAIYTGEKKIAGATGSTTATQAASAAYCWITLALKNDTGGGGQTLTPGVLSNSQTFYAPTVTRGAIALSPAVLGNAQSFFAPSISQILAAPLIVSGSGTYSPTVAPGPVALSPSLLTNGQSFQAASVAPGPVLLGPALHTNSSAFFGTTVTPGAVSLAPSLLAGASALHAPAVSAGSVTISPPLLSNVPILFGPAVGSGTAALAPPLLINAPTFHAPEVTVGPVSIAPGLLPSASGFPAPTVAPGPVQLLPSVVANDNAFYPATIVQAGAPGQLLEPDLFVSASIIFPGSVRLVLPVPPGRTVIAAIEDRTARTAVQPSRIAGSTTEERVATSPPQPSRVATAVTERRIAS